MAVVFVKVAIDDFLEFTVLDGTIQPVESITGMFNESVRLRTTFPDG